MVEALVENKPVLVVKISDDEIYTVSKLIFTPDNMKKFWEHAKEFPTIYGKEFLGGVSEFLTAIGITQGPNGYESNGIFWVINDFTGVFYLTDIIADDGDLVDALAHYTFFDRRHKGRERLLTEMLHYLFKRYQFVRLSVEIPNYATPQARHFILDCGFKYEGKKRRAAKYKQDLFDVNLYGILRSEIP